MVCITFYKIFAPLRLCAFAFYFLLFQLLAQSDGSQQNLTGRAGTFAITNARIVTVSGATIENGTIRYSKRKNLAVGANVSIPAGAERIDGSGLTVYPGMIDAGTNMGLAEIGHGAPGTVDVAETGDMNANAKAINGINPHSVAYQCHARQRHHDRSFDAGRRHYFRSVGGYQSERLDAGGNGDCSRHSVWS